MTLWLVDEADVTAMVFLIAQGALQPLLRRAMRITFLCRRKSNARKNAKRFPLGIAKKQKEIERFAVSVKR